MKFCENCNIEFDTEENECPYCWQELLDLSDDDFGDMGGFGGFGGGFGGGDAFSMMFGGNDFEPGDDEEPDDDYDGDDFADDCYL